MQVTREEDTYRLIVLSEYDRMRTGLMASPLEQSTMKVFPFYWGILKNI